MKGYYTKVQLQSVISGVQYGREMLRKRGRHPVVFLDACMSLGAIHIPGEATNTALRRQIGRQVLEALDGDRYVIDQTGVSATAVAAIRREIKRALTETLWVTLENASELLGFRVDYIGKVDDVDACEKHLLDCAHVTAGHGIWLKQSIAVLPACFDGAAFVPLYEHQATYLDPKIDRVEDMSPTAILERIERLGSS